MRRTRRRRRCSAPAGRRGGSSASAATTRSTPAGGIPRPWSPPPPRQEEGHHRLRRRLDLVALDGAGRVDVLRAHAGALADERAAPHALVLDEDVEPLPRAAIPGVEVVALGECDRRG